MPHFEKNIAQILHKTSIKESASKCVNFCHDLDLQSIFFQVKHFITTLKGGSGNRVFSWVKVLCLSWLHYSLVPISRHWSINQHISFIWPLLFPIYEAWLLIGSMANFLLKDGVGIKEFGGKFNESWIRVPWLVFKTKEYQRRGSI